MRLGRALGGVTATVAVAASLAWAPAALGATFVVNDIGDAADANGDFDSGGSFNGTCDTIAGGAPTCTLRAALAEAEATAPADDIHFDLTALGADPTITVGVSFDDSGQRIDNPVTIDGCVRDAPNSPEPCVGIHWGESGGLSRGFWITSGAGAFAVRGIAFTRFGTGIQFESIFAAGDASLEVQNNWFGIKVDGTQPANTAIQSFGVELLGDNITLGGPDGATGTQPADRNVFASGFVGARVFDGGNTAGEDDNIVIQGNYFGTMPDGATAPPSGTQTNLRVVDWTTTGFAQPPSGTLIGGTVTGPAATTPACDGVCNVFGPVGSSRNIDLTGDTAFQENPAGPTTIAGNHIGMDVNGTTAKLTPSAIQANGVPGLTVGGPAAGDRNYIRATNTAIGANAANNTDTVVRNNFIGLSRAGDALSPPQTGAILRSDTTDPLTFSENRVAATTGNSLLSTGGGALVEDNILGIEADGDSTTSGGPALRLAGAPETTIRDNIIGNATGDGISLEGGDEAIVTGNLIGTDGGATDHGNGGDGIRISEFATPTVDVTIGGDTPAELNTISNNAGSAINLTSGMDGADGNQILRNVGAGNDEPFIDLGDDGLGNAGLNAPNEGVLPPVIATAGANYATGTGAAPDADILVYSRATASSGEASTFLGSTTADSLGVWELEYATPVADGARVIANQNDTNGNGSELSEPAVVTDGIPPSIAITSGPSGLTNSSTAAFGFSPEAGATVECALDASEPVPCAGAQSHSFSGVPDGQHTFTVTATDADFNQANATRTFTVDTKGPTVAIRKKKGGGSRPKFTLTASEAGSTLECKLDKGAFRACAAAYKARRLAPGKHKLQVRATDAAGNLGAVATKKFKLVV